MHQNPNQMINKEVNALHDCGVTYRWKARILMLTFICMMQNDITGFRTPVLYPKVPPSISHHSCVLRENTRRCVKQINSGASASRVSSSKRKNGSINPSLIDSETEAEPTITQTIAGGPVALFQDLLRNQNIMFWRPHKPTKQLHGSLRAKRNFFDNSNEEFRYKSPQMTQEGYALTILKNSRKKNKPVLWRYALAKYKEMNVQKCNVHHEAALVACAKLGLYREALEILLEVTSQTKQEKINGLERTVWVNEGMLSSIVKACVRASRRISSKERRRILNYAKSIVLKAEKSYGIRICSHLVNPLVARYQRLRLYDETAELLDALSERTGKSDELNINNFSAKDSASYGLIVREAVITENWSDAVQALKNMTDHGVFPMERQINSWSEATYKNSRGRSIGNDVDIGDTEFDDI